MNWTRMKLTATVAFVAAPLVACNPALFFDGVDKGPPPPTRKVHRDLEREMRALERELAATQQALEQARNASPENEQAGPTPAELATTWTEAAAVLPTDYAGQTDWVLALANGAVAPRPGFEPGTPEQAVFDFDVQFADAADPALHVTYPHAPHTQWLSCDNCHPAIFPLERGAEPPAITMDSIKAGEHCGVCHGKVAFAADEACARCHQGLPNQADWRATEEPRAPMETAQTWAEAERLLPVTQGMPDWAKALVDGVIVPRAGIDPETRHQPVLPLNIELVPEAVPAYKVVYPHAPHTAVLSCASCHPGIFEMRAGADPINMQKIFAGEYCGRCHGKVAFDVTTGCPRCHELLATGQ